MAPDRRLSGLLLQGFTSDLLAMLNTGCRSLFSRVLSQVLFEQSLLHLESFLALLLQPGAIKFAEHKADRQLDNQVKVLRKQNAQ